MYYPDALTYLLVWLYNLWQVSCLLRTLRKIHDKYIHKKLRSSHSGVTLWVESLQCQDTGSIPSLAQWVKGSSVCHSCSIGHDCGLDLIPGPGTPYAVGWPKKKKEEEVEREDCCHVLPWCLPHMMSCHPRTLLQTCKCPHPSDTTVSVADSGLFLHS